MNIGPPAQSTDFSLKVLAGTRCNTFREAEVLERKKGRWE